MINLLRIVFEDDFGIERLERHHGCVLKKHQCEHILKNARDDVSLDEAIDVIIKHMFSEFASEIQVDINLRNQIWANQTKEMTLEEIEKELGHKVKIVSKED